jgi:bisphosphoglycerate-dependent phosphoglycerate mutase
MKKPLLKILLISLMLLSISTGCVSKKAITDEFVDCLLKTNAGIVDKVDSELQIIDQNLYITEEKLLKLEQVVVPAQEWIEKQKVELLDEHKYGSWHSRVTPESLDKFKNDQYEVTALELTVHGIGTPNQEFYAVLKVTDLSTKIQSDWETIENELKWRKSTLEQQRQVKLEAGQLSTSTLLSVIEHVGDWEIREINSTTYSISGPGLGMDGELTTGKWTYDRTSKEIIPADTQSAALQDVLSGGL